MDEFEQKRNRVVSWLRGELERGDAESLMERYDIRLIGREEAMMLDFSDDDSIKFRNYHREGAASWFVVSRDVIDKILVLEGLPDA